MLSLFDKEGGGDEETIYLLSTLDRKVPYLAVLVYRGDGETHEHLQI